MANAESLPPADRAASERMAPADAVLADAARAARTGHARLAALASDLFRDADLRIDEARRTRMRAMLDDLIRTAEGRLRRDVADRLEPAAPAAPVMALRNMMLPIARPVLDAAGGVADTALVAVLARRVDEHRLILQARIAATQDPQLTERNLFAGLMTHADAGLADAARGVAALMPARAGAYAEPAATLADLPAAEQATLLWRIAAALRHWLAAQDGLAAAAVDRAVAGAAGAILAEIATATGVDAAALTLARAMLRAGVADDAATVALAAEGQVAVAVAGLALRVGITMPAAWDMVLDPDGARLVLLLRAAGLERSAVAALLLRWPDGAASIDRIAARMAGYDALPIPAAQAAIDLHRLDPAYLRALDALAAGLAR